MLLTARSLEKRYGSETVFSHISFTIDEGHKVALVGRNGVGKSTLLKLLAGSEEPDSGSVTITGGRQISYLPQEFSFDESRTGAQYLFDDEVLKPHQAFRVLEGLGVSQATAERPLTSLSGGEQSKFLLTRFLLLPSDILLLDEPTNNLDIPSLLWLETFLATSKKALILISHDVVFLDTVANRVFELKEGALSLSRGTYGEYLTREKQDRERVSREYARYMQELSTLRKRERQLQKKGERIDATEASDGDKLAAGRRRDRASEGQSEVRVIAGKIRRLEEIEKPFEDEPLSFAVRPRQSEGDISLTATAVVAGYAEALSVGPISLTLQFGERLCLLGMNGMGKSTLLKTLVGLQAPLEGEVALSESVVLGDFLQHHERAEREESAVSFFLKETGGSTEQALHKLKRVGFTEQMIAQRVAGLSSGMRARLLFAVFSALNVNVLVLDEPTNHLDVEAVAALKELLKVYQGIVLLVSHNRGFLDALRIDRFYVVSSEGVSRITDFEAYVSEAKGRAERMVRQLRSALQNR